LDPVERLGEVMKEPAQRIRHRLRLVVVIEACEVPPAAIAAQLDQTGAELDPENYPAKEQDQRPRGNCGTGAEEDGEKACLQEQRLPPERVEDLTDIDDRLVERPEREPDRNRDPRRRNGGQPNHDGETESDTGPGNGAQP